MSDLELISYPVPMRGGLARLYLPAGLTTDEAQRIKSIVDALVFPSSPDVGER